MTAILSSHMLISVPSCIRIEIGSDGVHDFKLNNFLFLLIKQ